MRCGAGINTPIPKPSNALAVGLEAMRRNGRNAPKKYDECEGNVANERHFLKRRLAERVPEDKRDGEGQQGGAGIHPRSEATEAGVQESSACCGKK